MFSRNSIKMIVSDMAGTIIQENGIVYNALYNTIKLINPNLKKEEINNFHGCSKKEVIDFFVDKERMNSPEVVKSNLNSEFNYYLKKEYTENTSVTGYQCRDCNYVVSGCPSCGSDDLIDTGYNNEDYQCRDCSH